MHAALAGHQPCQGENTDEEVHTRIIAPIRWWRTKRLGTADSAVKAARLQRTSREVLAVGSLKFQLVPRQRNFGQDLSGDANFSVRARIATLPRPACTSVVSRPLFCSLPLQILTTFLHIRLSTILRLTSIELDLRIDCSRYCLAVQSTQAQRASS